MSKIEQHSALGASSAFRWLACRGSVRMSDGVPDTGTVSSYAVEGTLAHSYAEARLNGTMITAGDVPEEMPEYVEIYINLIRNYQMQCSWYEVEHRFDLAPLNPPIDAYGTADFVGYLPELKELVVCDLKYGTGIIVEPTDNPQLLYYGVGALLSFQQVFIDKNEAPPQVDKVRLIIIQPRVSHPDGRIREAVIDVQDLLEFSITLIEAMHETQTPNAPLVAGSHCRFCRAAAICPALFAKNQETAQTEFLELPEEKSKALEVAANPLVMTNDQVGVLLGKLDSVEHWINSVRMYAQNELERGRPVPGWKLVAKQARRKWADEAAAGDWLVEFAGLPEDDIEVIKLKSPAQIEKMMPSINIPGEHIIKQSSGNKIARESSPLPEITGGMEFFV